MRLYYPAMLFWTPEDRLLGVVLPNPRHASMIQRVAQERTRATWHPTSNTVNIENEEGYRLSFQPLLAVEFPAGTEIDNAYSEMRGIARFEGDL